jgi:hypothetical protein
MTNHSSKLVTSMCQMNHVVDLVDLADLGWVVEEQGI